ncbi:MAG: phosphatidylserine decarboxylase [Proteobacteria bacterium]|nr:MAG: phosphatidylserine decarboxylase [Pseudomonadota bacterium]
MRITLVNGLGRILPLNAISWLTGKISEVKLPKSLQTSLNSGFAKVFGIDVAEAEKPISEYASIEDFFTRKLKIGARPIAGELCSPADGILSVSGPAENATAIQAKGLTYSLKELMFGENSTETVSLRAWATIYLAPHNYHRVHSPITATLKMIRYFPGELWPVNSPSVGFTPRLFTRNERLVFELETSEGTLYLAMVGALNVGKMTSPFLHNFATNSSPLKKEGPQIFCLDKPAAIKAGQELGTFLLGSTVIIAFDESLAKGYRISKAWPSRSIRMGEALGQQS